MKAGGNQEKGFKKLAVLFVMLFLLTGIVTRTDSSLLNTGWSIQAAAEELAAVTSLGGESEEPAGEEAGTGSMGITRREVEEEAEPIGKAIIRIGSLNVRNSAHGNVIGNVCEDEEVLIYAEDGNMLAVRLEDGRCGYIYGKYTDYYDTEGNLISEAELPEPVVVPEPTPEPAPEPAPEPVPEPAPEPTPAPVLSLQEMSDVQLADYVISQCITPEMNAFEQVIAVDAWLCANTEYNLNYYTVKDCIANGLARCQGYANAFKCIMERLGVPTNYCRGKSYGENHAWNRSLINGQYYYTDVTWNDVGSASSQEYLLISYEQMSIEHAETMVLEGYNQ